MCGVLAAVALALCLVLGLTAPVHAAGSDLKGARARAQAAAAELAAAQTHVAELEQQVAALEQQTAASKANVAGLGAVVRELALSEFMTGHDNGVSMLDVDLGASARAEAFAGFVSGGTGDALDRYRAATQDMEAAGAALEGQRAAMAAAVADLDRRSADAMAEVVRLERIEAERRAREAAERKAQEEAARQSAAREDASRQTVAPVAGAANDASSAPRAPAPAAAPAPAPASGGGGWLCPVQGPVAFVDSFGAPRSGGRRHQGVDMLSPRGTPVVASVSGSVKSHSSSLGGISYYLSGDDGNEYYGAHLSALSGVRGRVERGTVVGYVGDSGNARGTNHLHFEIHPGGGGAINPYPTVSRYC